MPQAEESNNTNRRAFLATMAVAMPAVIAGLPMAAALADPPAGKAAIDPKAAIDQFANLLLSVDVAAINENADYVVYSVRVPREALGADPYDGLVGLHDDDTFGADLTAWLTARIQNS